MYSVDAKDTVVELADVPLPSAGAPAPFIMCNDYLLLLTYALQEKPYTFDGRILTDADVNAMRGRAALIEFTLARVHMFGSPNDETLHGHPLHSRGLRSYGAFEVRRSSWIRQLERMNSVHSQHDPRRFDKLHHYIITFHDSTFECIAEGFEAVELAASTDVVMAEMQTRMSRYQ